MNVNFLPPELPSAHATSAMLFPHRAAAKQMYACGQESPLGCTDSPRFSWTTPTVGAQWSDALGSGVERGDVLVVASPLSPPSHRSPQFPARPHAFWPHVFSSLASAPQGGKHCRCVEATPVAETFHSKRPCQIFLRGPIICRAQFNATPYYQGSV